MSTSKPRSKSAGRTEAAKAKLLVKYIIELTGLSIDDIIKEIEGTSAQKAKAQLANQLKMTSHMNPISKSAEDQSQL